MRNIVLFILSILVVYGILNLIYLTADWISANVPPIIIYLVIVGGFAGIAYYFYKKEVE
jgi:hypothetical protein